MSEQENYLFKVIGSIIVGYGMEKPSKETLAIAHKIIDLVAKDTEQRIIATLEKHTGYGDSEQDEYFYDAIALIKGEN